ncbi:MAG: hypothetical protein AAGA54_23135 [Myxococcota bacterium]
MVRRWWVLCVVLAGCADAPDSAFDGADEAPAGGKADATDPDGADVDLGAFGGVPDDTSFPAAGRLVVQDVRLGCDGELFEGDQSWCGSVLVTPTVSLTAAHCLQSLVDKDDLSLSSVEIQGRAYAVTEWSLDPTYGGFHRGSHDHQTPLRPLATAGRGAPKVGTLSPSLEPPTITSRLANAGVGSDLALVVHERVDDVAPSRIYLEETDGLHDEGFDIGETFTLVSYGPSHRAEGPGFRRDARHRASVAANPAGSGGGHTSTLVKRDFAFYIDGRPAAQTSVERDEVRYGYFSGTAGPDTPQFQACKGDSGSPAFAGTGDAASVVGVMHGFSTAAGASTSQTRKLEDDAAGCTVCNPGFGLASLGSPGARAFVCAVLAAAERDELQRTTPGYCAS